MPTSDSCVWEEGFAGGGDQWGLGFNRTGKALKLWRGEVPRGVNGRETDRPTTVLADDVIAFRPIQFEQSEGTDEL